MPPDLNVQCSIITPAARTGDAYGERHRGYQKSPLLEVDG